MVLDTIGALICSNLNIDPKQDHNYKQMRFEEFAFVNTSIFTWVLFSEPANGVHTRDIFTSGCWLHCLSDLNETTSVIYKQLDRRNART